jgi:hypothetical protein
MLDLRRVEGAGVHGFEDDLLAATHRGPPVCAPIEPSLDDGDAELIHGPR